MHVQEVTSTRLSLIHRPIKQWTFGGMFTLMGTGLLLSTFCFQPISSRLTCQRVSGTHVNCDLRVSPLLGWAHTQTLYDVSGASYQVRSGGRSSRSFVQLTMPSQTVELLSNEDGGYAEQKATVSRINNFLATVPSTPLSIQQTNRMATLMYAMISLSWLGFGAWFLFTPKVTCTFYKGLNKVVLERQRLFRSHSKVSEYPLDQLFQLDIDSRRARYGKVYRPILVLRSGDRIPLTQDYGSEEKARSAIAHIRLFLEHLPSGW